ncbi:Phosphoheptose isomerase [uncultured archaeon]|nr:Phosphoheptose isomerase [uncultured archaeon]
MTDPEKEADKYLKKVADTINKIDRKKIAQLTDLMLTTYQKNGTIYIFGNGGSAANASHMTGDIIKDYSYGRKKRFKAICLSDNTPALMAYANDVSYEDVFVEQLKNFLDKDDLVIGISGSGNSMNVVKALLYAKEKGAKTVAFCGFDGGKIRGIADLALHAEINDMEVSEDVHLALAHCAKRIISKKIPPEK